MLAGSTATSVSIPCFAIACFVFSMRARYSDFSNGCIALPPLFSAVTSCHTNPRDPRKENLLSSGHEPTRREQRIAARGDQELGQGHELVGPVRLIGDAARAEQHHRRDSAPLQE